MTNVSRREALKLAGATGLVALAAPAGVECQGASSNARVETIYGNHLVFDGDYYYLDCNCDNIHDPAAAFTPRRAYSSMELRGRPAGHTEATCRASALPGVCPVGAVGSVVVARPCHGASASSDSPR